MNVIEKIKRIISGYYIEQSEKLYIPEDILRDVIFAAASNSSLIEQFCVLQDGVFDEILFQSIDQVAEKGSKEIRQYLAINNIKQLDDCRYYINEKKDLHFFQGIALLSNVDWEVMPELCSFIMFNKQYAIVLEHDVNGGYFITKNQQLLEVCEKWLSIGTIDKCELDAFFLQEPLMMSADMMSEVSHVLCTHDHVNLDSCCWYHSVWQYLRLMNMVSTPSWHHDFYLKNLNKSLCEVSNPKVLISGTADYSSLSYVVHAMELLGIEGDYHVLDLCETPLFACKWYAKRKNISLKTMQMSIFDLNVNDVYDLICTDAFLTRFNKEQISSILRIWYKALKNRGSIVTTVRIHDENHPCPDVPAEEEIEAFSKKAYERSKAWGKVINYSPSEIAKKARVYASNMKSNKIGTRDEILTSFTKIGYELLAVEDVEVAGELYLSRYLRIRARKK